MDYLTGPPTIAKASPGWCRPPLPLSVSSEADKLTAVRYDVRNNDFEPLDGSSGRARATLDSRLNPGSDLIS